MQMCISSTGRSGHPCRKEHVVNGQTTGASKNRPPCCCSFPHNQKQRHTPSTRRRREHRVEAAVRRAIKTAACLVQTSRTAANASVHVSHIPPPSIAAGTWAPSSQARPRPFTAAVAWNVAIHRRPSRARRVPPRQTGGGRADVSLLSVCPPTSSPPFFSDEPAPGAPPPPNHVLLDVFCVAVHLSRVVRT